MNKFLLVSLLSWLTLSIQCMDSEEHTPFLEPLFNLTSDEQQYNYYEDCSDQEYTALTPTDKSPPHQIKKKTESRGIKKSISPKKRTIAYSKSVNTTAAQQLFSKFLYPAKPSDWPAIQSRKYCVSCPGCHFQAQDTTIASVMPKITCHLLNTQDAPHDNIDLYDIEHTLITTTLSNLRVQCVEPHCNYQGSKLYTTLMEAFKALHSHYSKHHANEPFTHEKIKTNILNSEDIKKYILIHKKPNMR